METTTPRKRIFIVDDHELVRLTLSDFILMEDDLVLCGMAASAAEALQLITDDCDLALVDVQMPEMDGIELVRLLRDKRPNLRCLMLSAHAEQVYVHNSLAAGARGYVMKGNPDTLLQAIRKVLSGNMYLSDEVQKYGTA